MLSCLWTTTQTWMWWQLLTGGGSTSTLAMPKERLVCLSILGEGSLLCGSSWVFFRLFSLLKGFFGGVFPFPFETLNGSLCFTNDVQCFLCFPSPSCLPLSVVADPGVEHKHSGAGGFLQSDHWHQQHNCHQINRICTQGQVRINRRSFCISTWTTPPPPLTLSSSPFGVLIPVLSFPLSLILPAFVLSCLLSSCFLINTADRIIRVYDGREILTCGRDGEPEPMQKLQDLVNRYVSTGPQQRTVGNKCYAVVELKIARIELANILPIAVSAWNLLGGKITRSCK